MVYLKTAVDEVGTSNFLIMDVKRVLDEFWSVIAPVQEIQRVSQKVQSFVAVHMYLMLIDLYFSMLDPSVPLVIGGCPLS